MRVLTAAAVLLLVMLHHSIAQDVTYQSPEFPSRPALVSQPNSVEDSVFGDASTPTPTPTPSPSSTPYPTPNPTHPTPTPNPDPSATPIPPNTYYNNTQQQGAGVVILNPEDIYKPITDRLDDLGKSNNNGASQNNAPDHTGADFSQRGHVDDIQGQVDALGSKTDAMSGKVQGAIGGLRDSFQTLPQSLGRVTTLNIGLDRFNHIGVRTWGGFSTLPAVIDLSPYMDGINLVRTLLLWVLTIAFGFLTVRAFTWTQ